MNFLIGITNGKHYFTFTDQKIMTKNAVVDSFQVKMKVQLTLEKHGFKLHGSTYIQIFFNKYI